MHGKLNPLLLVCSCFTDEYMTYRLKWVWSENPSLYPVSVRPDAEQWAGPRQWVTAPASCSCFRPFAPVCTASSDAAELTPSLPHPFLIIFISTHRHSHTSCLFLCVSVYILHFYSHSSKLTEVGKLPTAGASSRCSLFLSSLHLCCSLPPLALSLSRCIQCSVCACAFFFFFPQHTRSLSLSGGSSDAAVCASALQLPLVKTAALLDVFNPTGVVTEHSLRCFNFFF